MKNSKAEVRGLAANEKKGNGGTGHHTQSVRNIFTNCIAILVAQGLNRMRSCTRAVR